MMASTLKSKYDVYLSFRDKDTRRNFTSHLYGALTRNCIDAFIDNGNVGAEGTSKSLFDKISESLVSVVIFSENYADSARCLDELVKIIESKEKMGQKVLPVFLGVEPTHVQEQAGAFGDGFNRVIQSGQFKDRERIWRRAIMETAKLSGWNSMDKSQEKIVEEIVNRVEDLLDQVSLHDQYDGFVGVSRVEKVESLLCIGSSERVRLIGIWGMGGIGKTTIAKHVFCRLSNRFDGACFIFNVRAKLEKDGLDCVQQNMILQLLGVKSTNEGPYLLFHTFRRRLRRKRLLIVLDDVDSPRQLRGLIGRDDFYGAGSRFIVTSRDKQTLKNGCTQVYEVEKLNQREALQLFKLHAFKHDQPIGKFNELSKRAIIYAKGLPLALEVLGCNLYGRDVEEWQIELSKLAEIPDIEITDILRSSYDGIDEKEKNIFLDIACLFQGWIKDRVESILDACGFYAGIGLSRLFDKALITESNGKLWMHDLLQQMGQNIVFHECMEDPGKRSRLWRWGDICDVLTRNMGTKKIELLSLDLSKATNTQLQQKVFNNMPRLRVLQFSYSTRGDPFLADVNLLLPNGLEYLPNNLRYLRWDQYPLPCLPAKFQPEYLVELVMQGSHLKQLSSSEFELWLPNLKHIDLSWSQNLTRLPDFSKMLKLESLTISNCVNLEEVPASMQKLMELKSFTSLYSRSLRSFPKCSHLTKLGSLSLLGCSKITKLPELPPNLSFLSLAQTSIKEFPSSSGCLSQLHSLILRDCAELESLPSSIGELKCLEDLNLSGCSKLSSIPESLGNLESLTELYLDGTAIISLPKSICNLGSLHTFEISYCANLDEFPENLGDLKSLRKIMADGSPLKSLPSSINHLSLLENLSCAKHKGKTLPSFTGLPGQIAGIGDSQILGLVSLSEINLRESDLESLPESIRYLPNLTRLYLSDSQRLIFLPELPSSLRRLEANNCTSLEYTHNLFTEDDQIVTEDTEFELVNCLKLTGDARNKISGNFLLRIQTLVTRQFRQNQDLDQEQKDYMPMARVCLPGSELPEWLNYTGVGSSLQIKEDINRRLDHCCRLAFGVVVSTANDQGPKKFGVECKWLTESGKEFFSSCCYPEVHLTYVPYDEWQFILQSVQLFLWYDTRELEASVLSNSTFEFRAVDYYDGQAIDGYEIVKCGITPIRKNSGSMRLSFGEDSNLLEEECIKENLGELS